MPHRGLPRLRLLRGRGRLNPPTAATTGTGYAQAVAELQARGRYGVRLGLERMELLMDELSHPEAGLRGALVAGTNGKGSVVAMVRSVLQAAGLHVGTMPKPHLVTYRERIAVDGRPISEERFAAAVHDVLPAIDQVAASAGPPTEFEALTAAAIVELSRSPIDLVLVEVGLGGRLDATNVLDPGVAVITNVQHDHERQLGPTLPRIGTEKAAIVKRGDLAVTGARGRGLAPIVERCRELEVPLRRAGRGQPYRARLRSAGWRGIVIDLVSPSRQLHDVAIGLLGSHQAENATVAVATVEAIADDARRRGMGLTVDDDAIRAGLASTRWPGRLELIEDRRAGRILLDGAHNPAGARALARALSELGVRDVPLVFGAMRDKRVAAMLAALRPLSPLPVFTAVDDPHARDARRLLEIWRHLGGADGDVAPDPAAALELAIARRRRPDDPVVVAGSLYLVGAVRGSLLGEPA